MSDGQRTQFVYNNIPDDAKVGDTPAGIDKLKGTIQKVQTYAFQNPAGLDAEEETYSNHQQTQETHK